MNHSLLRDAMLGTNAYEVRADALGYRSDRRKTVHMGKVYLDRDGQRRYAIPCLRCSHCSSPLAYRAQGSLWQHARGRG